MDNLRRVAAVTACVLACAGVEAQTDWKVWLEGRTAAFSGVVLIARGDAVQIVRAAGVADHASGRPNTPDTRFNIGSINKTFTALAVAQLIQQGRLSLDDTLAKHVPDYPNRDAAARITIRHLLTHRSGVAQFMGADLGGGSIADMTAVVAAAPLAFEPGARQEYSNGGYIVLGRVVEMAAGQPYSAYLSKNIYQPAGMTGSPGNPAGGALATAADLFAFSRALRAGRLLDARMTDYVLNGTFSGTPDPKFGFALREQAAGTHRFVGNGGGAPGVNAEFRFEPAGEYAVVVLANSNPARRDAVARRDPGPSGLISPAGARR